MSCAASRVPMDQTRQDVLRSGERLPSTLTQKAILFSNLGASGVLDPMNTLTSSVCDSSLVNQSARAQTGPCYARRRRTCHLRTSQIRRILGREREIPTGRSTFQNPFLYREHAREVYSEFPMREPKRPSRAIMLRAAFGVATLVCSVLWIASAWWSIRLTLGYGWRSVWTNGLFITSRYHANRPHNGIGVAVTGVGTNAADQRLEDGVFLWWPPPTSSDAQWFASIAGWTPALGLGVSAIALEICLARRRKQSCVGAICARCGYSIKGLCEGSTCPECGKPTLR